MQSTVIFALESPAYQDLNPDAPNRFKGILFDWSSRKITAIHIFQEDRFLKTVPADLPSDDVHRHLPHILTTGNCRFDFELVVDSRAADVRFQVVYEDGGLGNTYTYDTQSIFHDQEWFESQKTRLDHIPQPPEELVFATQGIEDVNAYKNSIIPGVYQMKRYLAQTGLDVTGIRSVIDIGCGTGRLLVGWYLDNPERLLAGYDINTELIDWARNHLPPSIRFHVNDLLPPIPNRQTSFDLLCMASVFTHLSQHSQRLWIQEINQLLQPGGIAFITLHGETYLHLAGMASRLDEFYQQGFLEIVHPREGSNSYTSYHSPEYAKTMFRDFHMLGYFPRGALNDKLLFPVAALQDVYIFQKPHEDPLMVP